MVMRLHEFFAQYPIFTCQDFASALDAQRPHSVRTRESLLAYYAEKRRILRIRRGLYAVVPIGSDPDSFSFDPYLVAGKMTDDAVVAYQTALEFYKKGCSESKEFFFLTQRKPRHVHFRQYLFKGLPFPSATMKKNQTMFGVHREERLGITLHVTGLERTMVDLLDRPDLGGGWEEIWRSLADIEFSEVDQIIEYALLLGNSTTTAKVGLFLESHRESLMVKDHQLEALHERRPAKPHYLFRGARNSGRLISKWNLVVPKQLVVHSFGTSGYGNAER